MDLDLRIDQVVDALRAVDLAAEPQPSWTDVNALMSAARSALWAADRWQQEWRQAHAGQPFTKWDLLNEREREGYDRTPFVANGTGTCGKCGTVLATEGDFARHFTVADPTYSNLGECPNAKAS